MKKVYTTFRLSAEPGADVAVCGSFNNWKPVPMREPKPGKFARRFRLDSGEHQYKFVVNGRWIIDPECNEWCLNSHGTMNSICSVA